MSLDQYIEPAQSHEQPEVTEVLDGSVIPYEPDWRITALQSETEDPTAKEDAFASIVHEYEEPLSAYARNIVGSGMAEDVVQDAFLSAFKALGKFEDRDPNSLKNWLYRITHNRALNTIRKDQNSPVEGYSAADTEGQVEGPELPVIANATDRRYDPVLHQEFH
jgi:DNA-directed RNA polymerase specialized sigma24 family protein